MKKDGNPSVYLSFPNIWDRNWHLFLLQIGCQGFKGPFPPPFFISYGNELSAKLSSIYLICKQDYFYFLKLND